MTRTSPTGVAPTLERHREMYQRMLRHVEAMDGLTRKQIIQMANDPAEFRIRSN